MKILGSERKQNQVKLKVYADLSKILNKSDSQGLGFLVTQIPACWLTLPLLPQAEGETGSYIKWIQSKQTDLHTTYIMVEKSGSYGVQSMVI